ncbi:MAG: hypothetical protein HQK87_06690 [Nitrospinae bacterium]|nr:hypothetical protein [Nitrospinota bacterium]
MFKIRSVAELSAVGTGPAQEGLVPVTRPLVVEIGREPIMILGRREPRSVSLLFAYATPQDFGDTVRALWQDYRQRLEAQGGAPQEVTALVVGGSDHARWKANKLIATAQKGGAGEVLTASLNGALYRTVRIDPATGEILLREAPVVAAHTNPGSASLTLDDDLTGFGAPGGGDVVANATRFFRHEKTFSALTERVIPQFLQNRPDETFTLWSAACSNGTEAYSYAMYLHRLFTRMKFPPRFRILATDYNRSLVEFAAKGVYEPTKSDLATYRGLFSAYGTVTDKNVAFNDTVKRHITFKQYDLRKLPPSDKFCYIVAANVFQYYQPDARRGLLTNLSHALRPGGYLFANPYSPGMARDAGLEPVGEYQLYHLPCDAR